MNRTTQLLELTGPRATEEQALGGTLTVTIAFDRVPPSKVTAQALLRTGAGDSDQPMAAEAVLLELQPLDTETWGIAVGQELEVNLHSLLVHCTGGVNPSPLSARIESTTIPPAGWSDADIAEAVRSDNEIGAGKKSKKAEELVRLSHHPRSAYGRFLTAQRGVQATDPSNPELGPRSAMLLALDLLAYDVIVSDTQKRSHNAATSAVALRRIAPGAIPLTATEYQDIWKLLRLDVWQAIDQAKPPGADDDCKQKKLACHIDGLCATIELLTLARLGIDSVEKLTDNDVQALVADLAHFAAGTMRQPMSNNSGLFNCAPNGLPYSMLPTLAIRAFRRYSAGPHADKTRAPLWDAWSRATVTGLSIFETTYRKMELLRVPKKYKEVTAATETPHPPWLRSDVAAAVNLGATWRQPKREELYLELIHVMLADVGGADVGGALPLKDA